MSAWLSENPQAGDVMSGTGGARKVRFAGKGKGKSGRVSYNPLLWWERRSALSFDSHRQG